MMSIPVDADLLQAANWKCSNRLARKSEWLAGKCNAWLEGNAVVTPQGQLVDMLRVDYNPEGGYAAIIRYSADGLTGEFDPAHDSVAFPGGAKKFTLRHDAKTNRYWSLTNYVPNFEQPTRAASTRNTLALVSSANLRDWTVNCVVLYH